MPEQRTKLVYHFCDEQFGLLNLENSRLKVATVLELNDPFELSCYRLPDKIQRRAIRGLKNRFASRYGFICFSENFSSPLQWGHYADSHRGICLGFEVSVEKLHSVNYIDSMMEFDRDSYLGLSLDSKLDWFGGLIRTKHSHWNYERESRRLFSLADSISETKNGKQLFFRPFFEIGELKEVVVGCNSKISRARIQEALGSLKHTVSSFKARPAFNSYTMVENNEADLWK